MYKIEDIVGLEVISDDARVLGAAEKIVVDTTDWRAPALGIGLRKGVEEAMGLKKPLFGSASVFLQTSAVESVSDTITLNMSMKEVGKALLEPDTRPKSAGTIMGTRVIGRKGRKIGTVDNFTFEPYRDWAITYMHVRLDRGVIEDLNRKRSMLGAPEIRVRTEDVRTVGDIVMLEVDVVELRDFLEKKTGPEEKPEEEEEEEPEEKPGEEEEEEKEGLEEEPEEEPEEKSEEEEEEELTVPPEFGKKGEK